MRRKTYLRSPQGLTYIKQKTNMATSYKKMLLEDFIFRFKNDSIIIHCPIELYVHLRS